MKKTLFFFLALLAIFLGLPLKAAAESIQKFEANYDIDSSGVIRVTENITYDFDPGERHGIYRYIPYKYRLDNGEMAYLNISKISVADNNGHDYKFKKSQENNNLVLQIGDPNKTISGVKNYHITYEVKGGLRYFDTGDELFWNVNGTGWDVGIQRISATVTVPSEIAIEGIKLDCFRGSYGAPTQCQQKDLSGNKATFNDRSLGPNENLSILVGVPAGTFGRQDAGVFGSGLSEEFFTVLVGVALFFPVLTFFYMLRHWWRHGRDPKGRGTIIREYNPPFGLTAIETGTLLDHVVDDKDLSAEIIQLAIKGYLVIRREAGSNIFKKDDYTLVRVSNNTESLKPFDKMIIEGIFLDTNNEVRLSDLKNKFYLKLPKVREGVQQELVSQGFFKASAAGTIGKYIAIAIPVGIMGYFIGTAIGSLTGGVGAFIFIPAFIISALIIAAFGLAMPARTEKGVEAKEHVLGLKEYMSVAEADRIKFHNAPKKDPKKFEELLPYAMVLGVEKEWAKQFEGIYNAKPSWYDDTSGMPFAPIVFASHLQSFSSVVTKDMTSTPSSSGSGFGGGGFSGGGFGGGGGGSW